MSSSPFQITGVASGISWDSIIDEMINSASKPKKQWQDRIDTLELKKSLYEEVQSTIFELRSSMTALKLPSAYKKKTAEFNIHSSLSNTSDANNIIKATVNANAEIAQWDIDVKQLARSERYVSSQFSEPGAALGLSGKVRIQVGIQVAFLEVEASDSIRTINQKLNKLTTASGDSVALSAQLIDNRLVISGALTGLDSEGPLAETTMIMSDKLKETDSAGKTVYKMYLPRPGRGENENDPTSTEKSLPAQIYSLKSGDVSYTEGRDYTYDAKNGVITWLDGGRKPTDGAQVTAVFEAKLSVNTGSGTAAFTTGTSPTFDAGTGDATVIDLSDPTFATTKTVSGVQAIDVMPALEGGVLYKNLPGGENYVDEDAAKKAYMLYDGNGNRIDPAAYEFAYMETANGTKQQVILWKDKPATTSFTIVAGADNDYYVNNRQIHLIEENPTSKNSILYGLGITDIDDTDTSNVKVTYKNRTAAQDAKLMLNGVEVTRSTNQIPVEDNGSDALIANVKLELTGVGHVTMNVTQDASEIIENIEKFVEKYNAMMELINFRLEENDTKTQSNANKDTLSSLLSDTGGNTSFGLLHGDSLLWSVKNQMRRYISNSISSLSNDIRSRKFLYTNSALGFSGQLVINTGAMQTMLNIDRDDSLEAIQRKLNDAVPMNSIDGGKTPVDRALGLEVSIVDGQLIVTRASSYNGPMSENHTLTRSTTDGYDQLPFVPSTTAPVNGVMKVTSGQTTYVQGSDFELETVVNSSGIIESRIRWINGAKNPNGGSTYNVSYEYESSAVAYSTTGSEMNGLGLHFDASSIQMSSYGLSTTSEDYGKSGMLEFDSDKFFNALQGDTDMVSNVMLSFMGTIDTYIGNLVDSTNQVVGGNVITKGRFSAAIKRIDTEVSELQERIKNLERQLEDKQNSLYKQYSDMEQAIQTMNAQMSSIAQYLNSASQNNNNNNG